MNRSATRYSTSGRRVYQLAEQFRINRGTVSKLLERQGVPRRNCPLSPTQIGRATDLYAAGLSLVSVGKQLECDVRTVHLALPKAGVRMRDTHGRERYTASVVLLPDVSSSVSSLSRNQRPHSCLPRSAAGTYPLRSGRAGVRMRNIQGRERSTGSVVRHAWSRHFQTF